MYLNTGVKHHVCVGHDIYVCVRLAELASLLSRSVSYEGPALRKQVAKAQQLQQELSRRELECQSGAADMRERYNAACKQYGIKVAFRDNALFANLENYSESARR